MTNATIAGGAAALVLTVLALAAGCQPPEQDAGPAASPSATLSRAEGEAPGSLYGRVTIYDGTTYEGPLRWGGGEEAFWGHTFNGVKDENPWATQLPPEQLGGERERVEVFGVEIPWGEARVDLARPFMARFGDIVRIESRGDGMRGVLKDGVGFDPDVRVILKSGTVVDLDRLSSSDFDDGVRVWDGERGVVDLGPRQIRSIELLPNPGDVRAPLFGTVRTRQGDFTGFLQWDRKASVGRDEFVGRTADGELRLRFDAIRSIARHSGGSRVTTLDGGEVVLSGTRQVGPGNRGVYVDDPRYGRVLVSWDAFERVDFRPGGSGPAYDDFPRGRPLSGRVTTRDGRRYVGRLVYDLDESETTETLDAPSQGVDYTIPFGRVRSIVLPVREEGAAGRARVTLWSGEVLVLERTGDLGEGNGGMLVVVADAERPQYVPWAEVGRVDFDGPSAHPPVSGR